MKLFTLSERWRDVRWVLYLWALFLVLGCAFIGLQAESASPPYLSGAAWSAFLWAFGCMAVGFLAGFIFAIPRARKPDEKAANNDSGYSVNANLEEISDWLTKIVVGLGLVELSQIPGDLRRASRWVARSLADPTQTTFDQVVSLASCIIVYFSIVGFLAGYLLTRLFLAPALERATTSVSARYVSTGSTANKIRGFWQPEGAVNAANEKTLLKWLADNGHKISLASFAYLPKLESARQKAIDDLRIT